LMTSDSVFLLDSADGSKNPSVVSSIPEFSIAHPSTGSSGSDLFVKARIFVRKDLFEKQPPQVRRLLD
jgi:hypothetical protein